MNRKASALKIYIFYSEKTGEEPKFQESVQWLAGEYEATIGTDFVQTLQKSKSSECKNVYRYISKECFVANAADIQKNCQRQDKFIVFGNLDKNAKDPIPTSLWRFIQLLTNHIDRVREHIAKKQLTYQPLAIVSSYHILFYTQKGNPLDLVFERLLYTDKMNKIGTFSEQTSSSSKFTADNRVYCVVTMDDISMLYLQTKQFQMKCQTAFIVLVNSTDTADICQRLVNMYKQEFFVYNDQYQLTNALMDLTISDWLHPQATVKQVSYKVIPNQIHKIYNMKALTRQDAKYISIKNIDKISADIFQNIKPFIILIASEQKINELFLSLQKIKKDFNLLVISEKMASSSGIIFQSLRSINLLIMSGQLVSKVLDKIGYYQYEQINQISIVNQILQNRDQLDPETLYTVENQFFRDQQIIKVFSDKPAKRFLQVLQPILNKTVSNLLMYKKLEEVDQHLNKKDFVIVDSVYEIKPQVFSNRLIIISDYPGSDMKGRLRINLKDSSFYIRKQKQLEKAYSDYNQIFDIDRLGVYFLKGSSIDDNFYKRIQFSVRNLKVKLQVEQQYDEAKILEKITQSRNEINIIIGEQAVKSKLSRLESELKKLSIENLYKFIWKRHQTRFEVADIFAFQYKFLLQLTEFVRQHSKKYSLKPDHINVRIFTFQNTSIAKYLEERLYKKKAFRYADCSEFVKVSNEFQKNVKQVIFMNFDGYTQQMQKKIEELYRTHMISCQIILVTPTAYILKTFMRNKTSYSFLSQKQLKVKIDSFKSLKEQDIAVQKKLLNILQQGVNTKSDSTEKSTGKETQDFQINTTKFSPQKTLVPQILVTEVLPEKLELLPKRLSNDPTSHIKQAKQSQAITQSSERHLHQTSDMREASIEKKETDQKDISIEKKQPTILIQQAQNKTLNQRLLTPPAHSMKYFMNISPVRQNSEQQHLPETIKNIEQMCTQQLFDNTNPIDPLAKLQTQNSVDLEKMLDTSIVIETINRSDPAKAMNQQPSRILPQLFQKQNISTLPVNTVEIAKSDIDPAIKQSFKSKIQGLKSQMSKLSQQKRSKKLMLRESSTSSAFTKTPKSLSPSQKIQIKRPIGFKPKIKQINCQAEQQKRSEYFTVASVQEPEGPERKFKRITSLERHSYSARKLSNLKILKSRALKNNDDSKVRTSRSISKASSDVQAQDPYQKLSKYRKLWADRVSLMKSLEIFVPTHQQQLIKNLKMRLSQNKNIKVSNFVDGVDLDNKMISTSQNYVIIGRSKALFKQNNKATWLIVSQPILSPHQNIYFLPSLPYIEEFIVESLKHQTGNSKIKKPIRPKVHLLYKNSSEEQTKVAHLCLEKCKQIKVMSYKQGSLGVTITQICSESNIILLTSNGYDQQVYAIYSLRQNIELFICNGEDQLILNSHPLLQKIKILAAAQSQKQIPQTPSSSQHDISVSRVQTLAASRLNPSYKFFTHLLIVSGLNHTINCEKELHQIFKVTFLKYDSFAEANDLTKCLSSFEYCIVITDRTNQSPGYNVQYMAFKEGSQHELVQKAKTVMNSGNRKLLNLLISQNELLAVEYQKQKSIQRIVETLKERVSKIQFKENNSCYNNGVKLKKKGDSYQVFAQVGAKIQECISTPASGQIVQFFLHIDQIKHNLEIPIHLIENDKTIYFFYEPELRNLVQTFLFRKYNNRNNVKVEVILNKHLTQLEKISQILKNDLLIIILVKQQNLKLYNKLNRQIVHVICSSKQATINEQKSVHKFLTMMNMYGKSNPDAAMLSTSNILVLDDMIQHYFFTKEWEPQPILHSNSSSKLTLSSKFITTSKSQSVLKSQMLKPKQHRKLIKVILQGGQQYPSLNQFISARTELTLLKFNDLLQMLELVRDRENGQISILIVSENKTNLGLIKMAQSKIIILLIVCDRESVPMHKNAQNIKYIQSKRIGKVLHKITSQIIRKFNSVGDIIINCSVPEVNFIKLPQIQEDEDKRNLTVNIVEAGKEQCRSECSQNTFDFVFDPEGKQRVLDVSLYRNKYKFTSINHLRACIYKIMKNFYCEKYGDRQGLNTLLTSKFSEIQVIVSSNCDKKFEDKTLVLFPIDSQSRIHHTKVIYFKKKSEVDLVKKIAYYTKQLRNCQVRTCQKIQLFSKDEHILNQLVGISETQIYKNISEVYSLKSLKNKLVILRNQDYQEYQNEINFTKRCKAVIMDNKKNTKDSTTILAYCPQFEDLYRYLFSLGLTPVTKVLVDKRFSHLMTLLKRQAGESFDFELVEKESVKFSNNRNGKIVFISDDVSHQTDIISLIFQTEQSLQANINHLLRNLWKVSEPKQQK